MHRQLAQRLSAGDPGATRLIVRMMAGADDGDREAADALHLIAQFNPDSRERAMFAKMTEGGSARLVPHPHEASVARRDMTREDFNAHSRALKQGTAKWERDHDWRAEAKTAREHGHPLPPLPETSSPEAHHIMARNQEILTQNRIKVAEITPEIRGEKNKNAIALYRPNDRTIYMPFAGPSDALAATMTHETAHVIQRSQHRMRNVNNPAEYTHQEIVAEAATYIALRHYGIDNGITSFPYMTVYAYGAEDTARVEEETYLTVQQLLGGPHG